jgi:hypothetical protein
MIDKVTLRDGLLAASEGRTICGWANSITPGSTITVLATTGLVTTLQRGQKAFISQYCYAVESVSDDCIFEFGWLDPNGHFHALGPQKRVYTGATVTGCVAFDQDVNPPMVLSYAAGVRSITFRVDANDASCAITVGYHGWWEKE